MMRSKSSWLSTYAKLGFGRRAGRQREMRSANGRRHLRRRPFVVEPLEARQMLAVTVSTLGDELYNGGNLAAEAGDGGGLSLREAIAVATAGETVDFQASLTSGGFGEILLSNGALTINKNLTIDGPGAGILEVDGQLLGRVFVVTGGVDVTLRDFTVTRGMVTGTAEGGGINNSGNLTLDSMIVSNSTAANLGGGVASVGRLRIVNSTLEGNSANAGGALNTRTNNTDALIVESSTFVGNNAFSQGGAIRSHGSNGTGTTKIINSTFSGNTAQVHGGAIIITSVAPPLTIRNSTITNNTADTNKSDGTVGDGGGLYYGGGSVTLFNTIVSGNLAGAAHADDISGNSQPASSHNLLGADETSQPGTNNIFTDDVMMTALGDYGGSTRTHYLLPESPAIDAGSTALAINAAGSPLTLDQNGTGFRRVLGDRVDIGASEGHFIAHGSSMTVYGTDLADTIVIGQASISISTIGSFLLEPGFEYYGDVNIAALDGDDDVTLDPSFENLSNIDGDAGNDVLRGTPLVDGINGGTGNDTIYGRGGSDEINSGDGDDTIYGEEGDDYIWGEGGADVIHGGDGADHVIAGAGNDSLYGEGGADTLEGETGNDLIDGGTGNDILKGGLAQGGGGPGGGGGISGGNDTITGGAGQDTIEAGDGDDVVDGGDDNDTIYGEAGADQLRGGAGNDNIQGGLGNDLILGNAGSDTLLGGDGNDVMDGQDDTVDGGAGFDSPEFVDDLSPSGFSTQGTWTSTAGGYKGTQLVASAAPGNTATWTFTGVPVEDVQSYAVYITWNPVVNGATAPVFSITDSNGVPIRTFEGNQLTFPATNMSAAVPSSIVVDGRTWHRLAVFRADPSGTRGFAGDEIRVTLSGDQAGKFLVADGVQLVGAVPSTPALPLPTGIQVTMTTETTHHIQWTNPSPASGADIYEIQYSTNGIDNWQFLNHVYASRSQLPNVGTAVSRYYRMRAVNFENGSPEKGYSNWSAPVRVSLFDEDRVVKLSGESSTVDLGSGLEPRLTLNWAVQLGEATSTWTVGRRLWRTSSWTTVASGIQVTDPTSTQISWHDDTVSDGQVYEYRVQRSGGSLTAGTGYAVVGVVRPLVENRGTLILIVDQTKAAALSVELGRLEQDLVGDGWKVIRHDVAPSATDTGASVAAVKALIQADYNADPTNVKSVFLFGDIAVPYSGRHNPDGHASRTMPADVYYGDVVDTHLWTDIEDQSYLGSADAAAVTVTNVAGDGRFDQEFAPSTVELSVGRVDLSRMPAYTNDPEMLGLTGAALETELLRRYLNKDHAFRMGEFEFADRALMAETTGNDFDTEDAWRNYPGLVGSENMVIGHQGFSWLHTMDDPEMASLFAESRGTAAGGGTGMNLSDGIPEAGTTDTQVYTSARPSYNVFTRFSASYITDWNKPDNFMQSFLARDGYGLTSVFDRHENWNLRDMGIGETRGEAHRSAQVVGTDADSTYRQTYYNLLGDPTLRMDIVKPASNLVATDAAGGTVDLTWTASPDPQVLGYHVYRAPVGTNNYTRLTVGGHVTGTTYQDAGPAADTATYQYMVRAVKLEVSSGTYYNLSQGAFSEIGGGGGSGMMMSGFASFGSDETASSGIRGARSTRFRGAAWSDQGSLARQLLASRLRSVSNVAESSDAALSPSMSDEIESARGPTDGPRVAGRGALDLAFDEIGR